MILKKLFGVKDVEVKETTESKLSRAQQDVDEALGMFSVAKDKISKASTVIAEAIAEDEEEIKRREENITKAKEKLEGYNRVRARLSEFIPEED